MTEKARINIQVVANTAEIREETRNGRKVIVVPSATLPDDVVMNRIKYPADVIGRTYKSLENTPAPFGHPKVGGKFVSARDPEAINISHIGAWNANVRRENGRVFLDKIIDVEVANQTPNGKAVLAAINAKKPIHTSTGLVASLIPVANQDGYDKEVVDMVFDHDAILLNEAGAATPDQGVGMLVNADGTTEELPVINSAVARADEDLDWALQSLASAVDKRKKAPIIDRIKQMVLDMIKSEDEPVKNTTVNEDSEMDEKKLTEVVNAQFTAFGAELTKSISEAIGNAVKPLVDAQAAMVANQKAQEDAEKAELVSKVVAANTLTEVVAKELTLNALRELVKTIPENKAAPVLNTQAKLGGSSEDVMKAYQVPKGE
ncbi:hypothetical protein [Rhizobium phage RHph_X3_2]|nr:hypothetical protein [Rhizobium phage RHph_X3_2]